MKRLDKEDNLIDEFRNEIDILRKYPNKYLLSLIGKCEESKEMIIVHEFMPNGTLADHLSKEDTTLSWKQLLGICLDAARGLDYLHNGIANTKRIIHRNVNAANIWLDENFAAKISDFGYAKVGPANMTRSAVTTDVKGTSAYLDPFYNLTGQLTRRTDTYAFGVVLFEVLCRRPAFDERLEQEQQMLGRWAQTCFKNGTLDKIVDTRLKRQVSPDCLKEFADVAYSCLLDEPNHRPKMSQVVEKLKSMLTKSQQKSPSTSYSSARRPGDGKSNTPKAEARRAASSSSSSMSRQRK